MCDISCRNRCLRDNMYLDHRSSLFRRLLSCSYTEKVQGDEPGNPRLNLKLSEYSPLSSIKFLKQTNQPSTYAKLNVNPTTFWLR